MDTPQNFAAGNMFRWLAEAHNRRDGVYRAEGT